MTVNNAAELLYRYKHYLTAFTTNGTFVPTKQKNVFKSSSGQYIKLAQSINIDVTNSLPVELSVVGFYEKINIWGFNLSVGFYYTQLKRSLFIHTCTKTHNF